MKLYLNNTSPYCRLAVATAVALDLKALELIWVDPWSSPENFVSMNPFSTIPLLEDSEGCRLTESFLIVESLVNHLSPDHQPLVARFSVAKRTSLEYRQLSYIRGMMELAVRGAVLNRFLNQPQEEPLFERNQVGLVRALKTLEQSPDLFPDLKRGISFELLNLGIALNYLKMRFEPMLKENIGTVTSEWLELWSELEVMRRTLPEFLAQQPKTVGELMNLPLVG